MSQYREQSQVGRFTPRPHFIVVTIAQRAHYKAESETACRVNVLKLASPNQSDLQQLWGQSTSKPNALSLHERFRVRIEDISAKTRASSENPLNNSCYLVGILRLNSPTIPVC